MKKFLFILILLFSNSVLFGQGLDNPEFIRAKKQLLIQVDSLKKHKPLDDYNGGWIARLEKEFYIDTFYIERLWALEIEYDGSTLGMNQATYRAEQAYDKLLNKYYKKLLDQLQGRDKEKLKVSQRNWLKFRDSEKEVNYALRDKQYNGGGTIHSIFVSNKNADITRQRVFEIYHYLDRIWQNTSKRK